VSCSFAKHAIPNLIAWETEENCMFQKVYKCNCINDDIHYNTDIEITDYISSAPCCVVSRLTINHEAVLDGPCLCLL